MKTTISRMFLLTAVVVVLIGASCPSPAPAINPDLLAISDPVKAEDAFFAVVKRVKGFEDKVDPLLIERFRESARDVWRGLETWRMTGDDSKYREHWMPMLERALAVEAAAWRK